MRCRLRLAFLMSGLLFMVYSCEPDEDPEIRLNSIEGTWKCEEDHYDLGHQVYFVDIQRNVEDSTKVLIYNFLGLNASLDGELFVSANINGRNLSIPSQSIDGHTVSGSGVVSSNYKTITLEYIDDIYQDGGDLVTAVYTRE